MSWSVPSANQNIRHCGVQLFWWGELLLQPIDMVVNQELADGDAGDEQQRCRRQHEVDEGG